MKKNEYLVQIAVIEARDLAAKDSSGSSDPFVKITVGNLPTQVSTAKMKATTAVFNQNFTFEGLRMSDVDFENFEAKIEMYDQNQFFQNELIGIHSIGLATLYRNPSHEIYCLLSKNLFFRIRQNFSFLNFLENNNTKIVLILKITSNQR